MRMLMTVTLPTEVANEYARKGTLGTTIAKLLEEAHPESVYFGTLGSGERSGMIVVDLNDASDRQVRRAVVHGIWRERQLRARDDAGRSRGRSAPLPTRCVDVVKTAVCESSRIVTGPD